MHLVNGAKWIDLSSYMNLQELHNNRSRFAYVIAKYPEQIYTSLVGIQDNLYDQTQIELGDFAKQRAKDIGSIDAKIFQDLGSFARFYTYCKYTYPVVGLNQAIYIRSIKQDRYGEKHLSASCIDTPVTHEFQFLFQWLNSQSIFDDYGRIVMFLNEPGVKTAIHRDYPNPRSHRNEFIWITLDSTKKFFILDDDGHRHYIDSNVAYFDNANWHGTDPSEYASWSLRVDGIFSKEFLYRSNLYDHFRSSR